MSAMFSTHDQCFSYLFAITGGKKRLCAKCKRRGAFHKHPTKPCYTCNCGRTHIYPKKHTIFQRSHVPLHAWFRALRLFHQKAGKYTNHALALDIGVSTRTAWRMIHKIRKRTEKMGKAWHEKPFETFLSYCIWPIQKLPQTHGSKTHSTQSSKLFK